MLLKCALNTIIIIIIIIIFLIYDDHKNVCLMYVHTKMNFTKLLKKWQWCIPNVDANFDIFDAELDIDVAISCCSSWICCSAWILIIALSCIELTVLDDVRKLIWLILLNSISSFSVCKALGEIILINQHLWHMSDQWMEIYSI